MKYVNIFIAARRLRNWIKNLSPEEKCKAKKVAIRSPVTIGHNANLCDSHLRSFNRKKNNFACNTCVWRVPLVSIEISKPLLTTNSIVRRLLDCPPYAIRILTEFDKFFICFFFLLLILIFCFFFLLLQTLRSLLPLAVTDIYFKCNLLLNITHIVCSCKISIWNFVANRKVSEKTKHSNENK